MPVNFLDPIYYDVADITDDMPNKDLLVELFERMNAQNERLWMFFTEMTEDPGHVVMKNEFIKPRQHRAKYKKRKAKAIEPKPIDNVDSDDFIEGYKSFMKEEFDAS